MEKKEKEAVYYFLGWLITGFLICFIGISNVFASTYNTNYELTQQYYDNRGSSLTNITTTWNESLQSYISDNITTVANSYGAGVSLTSPIPLIKNHTYSISFYFIERNNIALSSKNEVTVGTSLSDAKVNYTKDTYYADTIYSKVTNNSILQFVFKAGQNGNSIFIPWTTTNNVTQSYVFTEIIMEDLGSEGISQEDINNSLNNQTNELNQSIQNSTDTITGEIDDMEQSIIDSNKETQDVIKDQFNTCRDSINLFNINGSYVNATGTSNSINGESLTITGDLYSIGPFIDVKPNTNYTISIDSITSNNSGQFNITLYNGTTSTYLTQGNKNNKTITITTNSDTTQIRIYFYGTATYNKIQVQEGTVATKYESYGEEICSNKLDEAEETRKGIWATIRDLPNAFMDMLKGLFIPDDGYFEEWFNKLKLFFEEKLGFLVTPFTIIIDFVNRYLQLNPNEDIIINIPNITVPNFEEHIIISATTFNWSELLRSKESLNMLWELYLSFVDVFLILNFIGLCETKYNRIFGGDTTPYEYYTTEDSYMYDTDTGEITKMGVHKEKRTTRKKVT